MADILVIDDEPDVALGLRMLLERAGHQVRVEGDGRSGLRAFFAAHADVVILDVGMPVMDGWETLQRLRDLSEVPVLMLTARGLEQEKVRGLRAGADDYQTKPFSNQELLARVEALARRAAAARADTGAHHSDDWVTIDYATRTVTVAAGPVELSPLEFSLLTAFVRHPGHALTHRQLLELAWKDPAAGSRDQVKTYVRYLRRKLGWTEPGEGPIESVRGVGYRYGTVASG